MDPAQPQTDIGRTAQEMARQQGARLRGSTREVTSDVACLPLSLVNLYFFGEPGAGDRSWAMIDAGLITSASSILRAAEERFGIGSRPAAIILTHGHFDHVGALPELADHWDVPVYAHPLELPYLTGQSAYPPPDPAVGGGAMAWMAPLYPKGPIDLGDRVQPLPMDGSVPGMPDWKWIHTPGHAPGHISLFRESDRTLIVGDAFVTQKQESAWGVMSQVQHVHRPPAYFTPDWKSAQRSVERLAELRPNIAATGHGIPMAGEQLQIELDTLVRNWDQLALPSRGRYVRQPALMNEQGVVSVPAPVVAPQLVALAGLGIAAVGLFLFRGRPSTQE